MKPVRSMISVYMEQDTIFEHTYYYYSIICIKNTVQIFIKINSMLNTNDWCIFVFT